MPEGLDNSKKYSIDSTVELNQNFSENFDLKSAGIKMVDMLERQKELELQVIHYQNIAEER